MASFDVTIQTTVKWTDKNGQTLFDAVTISSVTKPARVCGSTDNSGWDTLYDASQTTIPPIGDSDPGDTPFYFGVFLDAASGVILKITDDAAGVTYVTVPASSNFELKSNIFGTTNASVIEQIDIQSLTATDATYEYVLMHD